MLRDGYLRHSSPIWVSPSLVLFVGGVCNHSTPLLLYLARRPVVHCLPSLELRYRTTIPGTTNRAPRRCLAPRPCTTSGSGLGNSITRGADLKHDTLHGLHSIHTTKAMQICRYRTQWTIKGFKVEGQHPNKGIQDCLICESDQQVPTIVPA